MNRSRLFIFLLIFAMCVSFVPVEAANGIQLTNTVPDVQMQKIVYGTDDFVRTTSNWYSSSTLVGYEGTPSVFAAGNDLKAGRWGLNLRKKGVGDVYFYNLMHTGNSATLSAVFYDSEGSPHAVTVTHNGNNANSSLINLGRFSFSGEGREYVEISSSAGGYLRINVLLVEFYGEETDDPDDGEYKTRALSEFDPGIFSPSQSARHIYVSPGNGGGMGTKDSPYLGIASAKEAVRGLIRAGFAQGGIVCEIEEGAYYLDDTLTFSQEDSGAENAPILWQATGDVRITTAKKIPKADFSKVDDEELLKRIDPDVKDSIYKVVVSGMNGEQMDPRSPYQVTFNGEAGYLSRWPDSGYERLGDIVDIGTRSDSGPRGRGFTYTVNNSRILKWKNEPNAWMNGYWLTAYTNEFAKIGDIDEKFLTISSVGTTDLGAYEEPRFMALNMLCELDKPGEWYIEGNTLYAYLPEGCEEAEIAYKQNGIIAFSDAHDIILRGIGLDNCNRSAVSISSNASRCGIEGGYIKNTSGTGISVGGAGCYVRDCDISYTGANGISISGGDKYYLSGAGNYAENCRITKTGRSTSSKAGISLSGCQNRISNCHIYDIPAQGIIASGMENIIEKNIIERTNLEISDTGGIYFLEYGMGYGTVIRNNIIRDSVGLNQIDGYSNEGALGIYLDDMSSGIEVSGNIIYNVREPAIFCHGGRCITVSNNLVIKCDESISLIKTSIAKNLSTNGVSAQNIRRYDNSVINTKYPRAVGALTDSFGDPKYNTVINNMVYNASDMNVGSVTRYSGTVSGNAADRFMPSSECGDFYDLDFDEIRAHASAFSDIPVRNIGIYTGGIRADTEDIIFDNRCESFETIYPKDGDIGLEKDVTLKWETKNGGISQTRIYISEDPEMADKKTYISRTDTLTVSLEYGKTYYWQAENIPFLGYSPEKNSNGITSFQTMAKEDKLKSLVKSMEFLEEFINTPSFPESVRDLPEVREEALSEPDTDIAISNAQAAINRVFADKRSGDMWQTAIYDNYSLDTEGERPFGLFLRSFETINVTACKTPEGSMGVRFVDNDTSAYQYTARYFYPEKEHIEFSSRIIAAQRNGNFSMNIVQTGKHATRDGILSGNAARITFASDGYIYADQAKEHNIGAYSANTAYDIKVDLDIRAGHYDVYVNGIKKAEDITINRQGISSAGSITYDTSDGTGDKTSKGTFYIDNTIVRVPIKYGNNTFLEELSVRGKRYDPQSTVIITGISDISPDDIAFNKDNGARYRITAEEGEIYISVLSQDLDNAVTYLIE